MAKIDEADQSRQPVELQYERQASRKWGDVVFLVFALLAAVIVALVGLLCTIGSAMLLYAWMEGDRSAPIIGAALCGPLGLLFLPGGFFVAWRAILELRGDPRAK